MKKTVLYSFLLLSIAFVPALPACTNYLVSKGATRDGSTMISYVADSHIRYGELYFIPGGPQAAGSFYQAYDRGSHKPLARVPNPALTYTVIGFMNERQVAIGETTFTSRDELNDPDGQLDYGSLMFLALQRSRTAREAIRTIADLTAQYGYTGAGESLSISDPNEVWFMEIVGRGPTKQKKDRGALWVALRIPEGYVSAHANQSRIDRIPLADGKTAITSRELDRLDQAPVQAIYSADIIEFARKKGYFQGPDSEFSFCDAFAPIDFGGARFCEARVWNLFRRVNREMESYRDVALGLDMSRRLPLWIMPDRLLTVQDLIAAKRDHLEGTEFDMAKDVGAGPYGLPYRWRPMTWKLDGKSYFHERTTATQQTAFSFIAQLRSWLPDSIGGLFWFGVDDTNTTVYMPFYAGIKRVPEALREGNGSILEFSDSAAFWIFNQLAQFAYLRYNEIYPDIRKVQTELEEQMQRASLAVDRAALELHKSDPETARDFLTSFSEGMTNQTVSRWKELYRFLMVKHLDGNRKKEENGVFLRNTYGRYPIVEHPELPDWWKRLIVEKTGERFLEPPAQKKE